MDNSDEAIVKEQIKSEIKKYFIELRQTWEESEQLIVRKSQIEAKILNLPTVLDVTNTMINGSTSNIELQKNYIPLLGEVNII